MAFSFVIQVSTGIFLASFVAKCLKKIRKYGDFTQSNVNELEEFIAQCKNLGVGNLIWMNNDHDNWIYGYDNFNFKVKFTQR